MQTRGKLRHSNKHKQLVDRLIQARKYAGLSQADVAKRLGKAQPNISKLEAGQRSVEVLELIELSKIYSRPLTFFIEKNDVFL